MVEDRLTTSVLRETLLTAGSPFSSFIPNITKHPFSNLEQHICVYSCHYNVENFTDDLYQYLAQDEPAAIQKAVTKRRAEFFAGRLMAALGLEALGNTHNVIDIGEHRSPLWPDGFLGSITHSCDQAMAVVAPKGQWRYLGMDHEEDIPLDIANNIAKQLLTHADRALYQQLDIDFANFCSAVFSIKESLFKAVYPHIGQYIEFSDANMLELDISKGSFKVELCWRKAPRGLQTVFAGHLLKTPGKVTTLIFA